MRLCIAFLAVLVAGLGSPVFAQDAPLFKQLVGTWTFESEATVAPGQPKVKAKGTERVKALGSLWVVLESKLTMMGTTMDNVMTIGVGPAGKALEGTFVSSMMGKLVVYKGALSKDGKSIELHTEQPDPSKAGKLSRQKDVITLLDNNRRTLKSFALDDNGKWVEYLSVAYRRVK